MITRKILKKTKKANKKVSCNEHHTWYEIHYNIKTAREQFIFDQTTYSHTEYTSEFDSYVWDNYKDTLNAYRRYEFPLNNNITGVVFISGFSDKPKITIEQVTEIANWIDKECKKLNQDLI